MKMTHHSKQHPFPSLAALCRGAVVVTHVRWLIMCVILWGAMASPLLAQDVFRMVTEGATRTVQNSMSGYTRRCMAQFKLDALHYLEQGATARLDSLERALLLDTQAYYLSEFMTLYFEVLLKNKRRGVTEESCRERVTLFMDAAASNPLFGDAPTEESQRYVTAGNSITPFPLNTDWQKAYYAAKVNL